MTTVPFFFLLKEVPYPLQVGSDTGSGRLTTVLNLTRNQVEIAKLCYTKVDAIATCNEFTQKTMTLFPKYYVAEVVANYNYTSKSTPSLGSLPIIYPPEFVANHRCHRCEQIATEDEFYSWSHCKLCRQATCDSCVCLVSGLKLAAPPRKRNFGDSHWVCGVCKLVYNAEHTEKLKDDFADTSSEEQ